MKKKFTILIIAIAFLAGGWQLFAKGPPAFPPSSGMLKSVYDTDANDKVDADKVDDLSGTYMTPAALITTLGADYSTAAKLKALMPITQTITIGSEAWTPTAGYRRVDTRATCSGTPSVITVGETGAITDAIVSFFNVGSNDCSIAYATNNFEHDGGAGNSIVVKAGESFEMKFESTAPKWVVTNNNTSTQWVSGIASKTPIHLDADAFAASFASISGNTSNMYGGLAIITGDGTAALPDATVGMNFGVHVRGAFTPIFEPLATGTDDTIILNGTSCGQGKYITGAGATTDIASFRYDEPNVWEVVAVGFTCEP